MSVQEAEGAVMPADRGDPASRASRLRFARDVARVRPDFALGYVIVGLVCLLAIFAPWLSPYSPVSADPSAYLQPPSLAHPLGTDNTGMDIATRLIYAPRIDLAIALLGTAVSALIGIPLGALVGYYDGVRTVQKTFAATVMRIMDVLQAFPVFVFAICLVAVFGQSIGSIVAAIAFVNIPIYLRLMRTQVLTLRGTRFVEAAFVSGASDLTILRRHIIPNAMAPALSQLSVNIGWSILLTAALSFVGAGVEAPTPEWGSMIASGFQSVMTGQWWPSVFPGVALGLTVFGFALIGSSVEVLSDPVARRRLSQAAQRRAVRRKEA
ncbi:ABC transporter permease [Allosediminivita pacifica]|uniref:Peptide/nickel transport system permease protein n=1 Tax=Allosediminivita pacifica TaxID=1267769 RepID=A0A2T6ATU0_9RHOB|nr:ABC transporter permease [Allosediminivita pacifica]PTX47231.1 peptide/nickel transport system permease protein [Allosediminivita pacifica]GGB09239.1 ABC transporter permease [Allosediminivita pacifica]